MNKTILIIFSAFITGIFMVSITKWSNRNNTPNTTKNTITVQVPCTKIPTVTHVIDTIKGVNAEVKVTHIESSNSSYDLNIVSIRTADGLVYYQVDHYGNMSLLPK